MLAGVLEIYGDVGTYNTYTSSITTNGGTLTIYGNVDVSSNGSVAITSIDSSVTVNGVVSCTAESNATTISAENSTVTVKGNVECTGINNCIGVKLDEVSTGNLYCCAPYVTNNAGNNYAIYVTGTSTANVYAGPSGPSGHWAIYGDGQATIAPIAGYWMQWKAGCTCQSASYYNDSINGTYSPTGATGTSFLIATGERFEFNSLACGPIADFTFIQDYGAFVISHEMGEGATDLYFANQGTLWTQKSSYFNRVTNCAPRNGSGNSDGVPGYIATSGATYFEGSPDQFYAPSEITVSGSFFSGGLPLSYHSDYNDYPVWHSRDNLVWLWYDNVPGDENYQNWLVTNIAPWHGDLSTLGAPTDILTSTLPGSFFNSELPDTNLVSRGVTYARGVIEGARPYAGVTLGD